jgi:hypothetical protein
MQLAAVGSVDGGAASWTSSDGVRWSPQTVPSVPLDEPLTGPEDPRIDLVLGGMGQLVRLGDTLYSFGGLNVMDSNRPVGWRRTDGMAWERINSQSEFFSAGVVVDVTASDSALLAATMGANPDVPSGLDYAHSASTWLWTPQTSWARGALAARPDDRIHITATAWSNGTYVAVGVRAEPTEGQTASAWPTTPSIWTSADGRTWSDVSVPDDLGALCTVRALPAGGFVGIAVGGGEFGAWTSETGDSWTENSTQPASGALTTIAPFVRGCEVTSLEHGLLATVPTVEAVLTWTSTDGRMWGPGETLDLRVYGPPAVAALGDDVVIFGTSREPSGAGTPQAVVLHGTVQP